MFRLALRSVRHNPKRLLLTAVAVALGVSLVAASHTLTNALSSGFSGLFSEIYGGVDVVVEADPDLVEPATDPFALSEGLFSHADVEAISALDGVEAAAGTIQVNGSILPPGEQDPLMAGGPSQIYNFSGIPALDGVTVIDGRGPESDDEIVLDIDTVPSMDLEIGDPVSIATTDGVTTFELVGTVRFGESNNLQTASLAMITTDAARELSGADLFATVGVVVADGQDASAVAGQIQDLLPEEGRALTGEQKAAEQAEVLDEVLNYIDIFAIVFALISLFVGGYIIVNTFRVIVTQRTREFGLLRAIGASGKQVRGAILLEALVVAIIAATIGIILGYLLAVVASWFVSLFVGDIFGSLTLPLAAVAWSYALGIVVTLISALLPAIHASRISPMAALLESATGGRKPLKVRNIVGAAMTLVGILVVTVGLYASLERPYIYVGVGAVILVLGVTLLAAQVLVPVAYALRAALTRAFGVDGKIAANNIRREPRRSANAAAALMIGVMLLALVATFTESFRTVVTAQFAATRADYFVFSAQGVISPDALDIIADVDGVEATSDFGFSNVTFEDTQVSLVAVDLETVEQVFALDTEPAITELDGGVFIDPTIRDRGVEVGDEVTLTTPEGDFTLEVQGEYLLAEGNNFIVDWPTGEQMLVDVPIAQSMIVAEDGADLDELQADIESALAADFPLVMVQQPGQLEQLTNQFVDLVLGLISALLGSALVIAILGVANTLLLSVTERTREIGLLRAVGLKRSSVWRMITVESVVMAIFGTILGMILGVGLGAALVLALEEFGFDGVTVPWGWMVVYTVLAAIAGVLAAVWPAWRASRLDILKAIATDG